MPAVLITSANRGLGLEFAKQYLADGWHVYAACRKPKSAEKLQRLARNEKNKVDIFAMDVTKASSIDRAAAKIRDGAIDVLINSAGITGKPGQKTGNVDYASWAQVLDVNTMGPLRVTEAFVDNVARSERKLVVTITSGMGSLADNTSGGSIAYRSSKAAVNMVMRSAAVDLARRGISCVLVNPGWVRTDTGGAGATLSPQESVAALRRLILQAWSRQYIASLRPPARACCVIGGRGVA
jgi:NAD(P)-dependent dehydrogenase (short-subunit alcohol dehydrogenase family)